MLSKLSAKKDHKQNNRTLHQGVASPQKEVDNKSKQNQDAGSSSGFVSSQPIGKYER